MLSSQFNSACRHHLVHKALNKGLFQWQNTFIAKTIAEKSNEMMAAIIMFINNKRRSYKQRIKSERRRIYKCTIKKTTLKDTDNILRGFRGACCVIKRC